jgi:deoxycytidylate deaminase
MSTLAADMTPYEQMQRAVDIVNSSLHPTNKIAAALSGSDTQGRPYTVAMTNYWPERIHACFGPDARIGKSSGTIHAETACLLTAPRTEGAAMHVTDVFCPNCAKNMAEAGIAAIYIDHKGFAKDFAARRVEAFETLSLPICRKAGVAVYTMKRKERAVAPLLDIPPDFVLLQDRPMTVGRVEKGLEVQTLSEAVSGLQEHSRRRFAASIARSEGGAHYLVTTFGDVSPGYSFTKDHAEIIAATGKYSLMMEPVNRLLMNAARQGLKLIDGLVYSSQVPTSREQVNLVGSGITSIRLDDLDTARDEDGLEALRLLTQAHILSASSLNMSS